MAHIGFYFASTDMLHKPSHDEFKPYWTTNWDVYYEWLDEKQLEHLEKHKRITFYNRHHGGPKIIKRKNLFITEVESKVKTPAVLISVMDRLGNYSIGLQAREGIAQGIKANFKPNQPIEHINLEDFPEWQV